MFNENLRPACLPDLNQKPNEKFYFSGWDSILYNIDDLFKYVVERESNEQCNNYYKKINNNSRMPHGIDNNTQLCTKIYKDACGVSLTLI